MYLLVLDLNVDIKSGDFIIKALCQNRKLFLCLKFKIDCFTFTAQKK